MALVGLLGYIHWKLLKSDALQAFQQFKSHVGLRFERKIKCFQADMRGEFQPFIPHLNKLGVKVKFSCPYTHQQNGIPERKHRSLVETSLTFLGHGHMPLRFWTKAFTTATFLIKNLPTPLFGFMSPFEKLFHKKPNYIFFKPFGYFFYPYLRNYSKHKLDFRLTNVYSLGTILSTKVISTYIHLGKCSYLGM